MGKGLCEARWWARRSAAATRGVPSRPHQAGWRASWSLRRCGSECSRTLRGAPHGAIARQALGAHLNTRTAGCGLGRAWCPGAAPRARRGVAHLRSRRRRGPGTRNGRRRGRPDGRCHTGRQRDPRGGDRCLAICRGSLTSCRGIIAFAEPLADPLSPSRGNANADPASVREYVRRSRTPAAGADSCTVARDRRRPLL